MKKNIIAIAMAVTMFGSCFQAVPAFAADEIKVTINNETVSFDVPPQTVNGRTMVPMRAIFEKLGAAVAWDGTTKTITGTKGTSVVKMVLGSKTMSVNGVTKTLDAPAATISGRTLVPVRAIAESFDCDVAWNNTTRTVEITSADTVKTYTSIEGDWVRVSSSQYYGSTINITKYSNEDKYQATHTSLSDLTIKGGAFAVGDLKMLEIIPTTEKTFITDSLSNNGTRSKNIITVNDDFSVMEFRCADNYVSETVGDYQKWVRITPDMDIEMMQKIADKIYRQYANSMHGIANSIYSSIGTVLYTKEEANKIIDDYFHLILEKTTLQAEREKIADKIHSLEKQINADKATMDRKNTAPAEKDALLQKITSAQNQIEILNEQDNEKRLRMLELFNIDDKIIKKYTDLFDKAGY